MVQQGRSSLALVWGLVCGGVYLALATLAHFMGVAIDRQIGALTIGQAVLLAIELISFLVAGILAGRRSGRMESGALAGVVAGLAVGIGSFLLLLGAGLVLRQQIHAQGLHSAALRALYIASLVRSGVGIGLAAVAGLALGALGGLLGRGSGGGRPYVVGTGAQPVGVAGGFAAPQTPYYPGGDAPTIQTPQPPQG
jgi:hypothetical protein